MRSIISKKKNKKGNIMLLIIFIVVLALILFVGFLMVVGSATLNWVFDEVTPELTNLGVVEGTNFTNIAEFTITPLNNLVQSFTWLTGVLYVLTLIASFGIVMVARTSPNKWLIGFYFALMFLLIVLTIFISNIYEDFATGNDDLALRLREHTVLNYMILYSPAIFTVIGFLTGMILFSGVAQEEESV